MCFFKLYLFFYEKISTSFFVIQFELITFNRRQLGILRSLRSLRTLVEPSMEIEQLDNEQLEHCWMMRHGTRVSSVNRVPERMDHSQIVGVQLDGPLERLLEPL